MSAPITVRVHNGEPRPLTYGEMTSLVGQDAKITGLHDDWTKVLGHAHVDSAALDGGDLVLDLTVNVVDPQVFADPLGGRPRAGIGFIRRTDVPSAVDLRSVFPDPAPVAAALPVERVAPTDDPPTGDDEAVRVIRPAGVGPVLPIGHHRAAALAEIAAKPSVAAKAYDTEEECVAHGGHCFERGDIIYATPSPSWPEACKHCPATRVGMSRSPVSYRYPDGRVEG